MDATVVVEGLGFLIALVTGAALARAQAGWQAQGVAPASFACRQASDDDDPMDWSTDQDSARDFGSSDRHRTSSIGDSLWTSPFEPDLGGAIGSNPATGLPMSNEVFDVMGNPYGFVLMH